MNIPYHWLGDEAESVIVDLEAYEQRVLELVPVRVDLTDPQADE